MKPQSGLSYCLLLALCWLALPAAWAQAPAWNDATIGSSTQNSGTSWTRGIAVDAAGNVFVTGTIGGQVTFGSTVLTSSGSDDIFIAKYVPSTKTWAWAVRGGGTGADMGLGIAVSGSNVYITGLLDNDAANSRNARFDTGAGNATVVQPGASTVDEFDIVVAKYTDNGTSATLGWVQVGGGTGVDIGYDIAASGTSVYVTGVITNSQADINRVRFGGTGSTPGALVQSGANASTSRDIVLAKYTDNGSSADVRWVQVAGGSSSDQGTSIAVAGTGVFVTGYITNSQADANTVRFGSTAAQAGAHATSTRDIVVAKYTDNGATATFDWSQVGGGTGGDEAFGIAVSGANVYITGALTNTRTDASSVLFGGSGLTPGTAAQYGAGTNTALTGSGADIFVAKYTDNGTSATLGWTQVGGGNQYDQGNGIAVSGTDVYVTGGISNTSANASAVLFGGSGTTLATVPRPGASSVYTGDVVVAKYTDNGNSATLDWTQAGGGSRAESGYDLALQGSTLYVGGQTNATVTGFNFGAANTAVLNSTRDVRALISSLDTGTGAWQTVASSAHGGVSTTRAVATDAAGNVFVTGFFSGQVAFGSTVLSADGVGESGTIGNDLFVAKYVPGTKTWAWALSGGGNGDDGGNGIAVSGNSVYVTGAFFNSRNDDNRVRFGGTGATAGTVQVNGLNRNNDAANSDLIVLKFTDNGTSATLDWNQTGGGYGNDQGFAIAAEGSSVYVTGHINNDLNDACNVRFGASGTTPGTVQQKGASTRLYPYTTDMVLAKYTDNGASVTLNWTLVGGGKETDAGYGVAVSGGRVYVTGHITNNLNDLNVVRFGGTGAMAGTWQQNGASTNGAIDNEGTGRDLFVAQYTDNGNSATLGWTQVGGGNLTDMGYGVAVSGTSVYVTGFITNTTTDARSVRFGGSGTTPGTVQQNGASTTNSTDLVVARYTDLGNAATLDWTQVGGGTGADKGYAITTDATGVYVTGSLTNSSTDANLVRFGGSGTDAGTTAQPGASPSAGKDLLVAKYVDDGAAATLEWLQVGGGAGTDEGYGIVVFDEKLYPTGMTVPTATFGSFVFTTPAAGQTDFLGELPTIYIPLPVTLTLFTAALDGQHAVRLTWATALEQNSALFEVERSTDGHSFRRVGSRTAATTSSGPRHYNLLDEQLPAGATFLYYRLKQVDQDGTFTYSPVRSVLLTAKSSLTLFPNPAKGTTTLTGSVPGTTVRVFDTLGRQVLATTADATGAATLTLPPRLAPGVYVVRAGATTRRLVVE
ncbi:T9SS type A sorting domain-containing protein [Hymenobacter guriensis]|uniref:T9SS type A sorting domain-containing protein n=1 Tax=Hymenobacter guriensis TaxID=2793065 RepID=A0ABS0L4J6_9BACT|nr:T9SS type A sorting domain-containing protein [Hymenobacter guriensis]MBG8555033.1 T9SS type A sorting domain-containing protein [Hymenobacter guriensis]